jgi:hypothetical protein
MKLILLFSLLLCCSVYYSSIALNIYSKTLPILYSNSYHQNKFVNNPYLFISYHPEFIQWTNENKFSDLPLKHLIEKFILTEIQDKNDTFRSEYYHKLMKDRDPNIIDKFVCYLAHMDLIWDENNEHNHIYLRSYCPQEFLVYSQDQSKQFSNEKSFQNFVFLIMGGSRKGFFILFQLFCFVAFISFPIILILFGDKLIFYLQNKNIKKQTTDSNVLLELNNNKLCLQQIQIKESEMAKSIQELKTNVQMSNLCIKEMKKKNEQFSSYIDKLKVTEDTLNKHMEELKSSMKEYISSRNK